MSGIPSWAVPGAKVMLVDDSPDRFGDLAIGRGRVYTLSAVSGQFSEPACQLGELKYRWYEWSRLSRFRPLVEPEIEAQLYHEAKKHGKLKAPARPEVVDA